MTDGPGDEPADADTERELTGMPTWVKVFALVAVVLVAIVVVLLLTGGHGGRHGPGQHMGLADLAR